MYIHLCLICQHQAWSEAVCCAVCSVHMVEETRHGERAAAMAVLGSVGLTSLWGLGLLLALMYSMQVSMDSPGILSTVIVACILSYSD